MLTVAQCREALGPDCDKTDEELERLAEDLHQLARVMVEVFIQHVQQGMTWSTESHCWIDPN